MFKDMLNAVVIAAVNTVSDKPEAIKEDIVAHLIEGVFVGEEIEGVAKKVFEMIGELEKQFEMMPRQKGQLAGYLLEHLDLPRDNVPLNVTEQLVDIATAGAESETVAVIDLKLDIENNPAQSVTVLRQDNTNKESEITHTVIAVKVSKLKMLLFVLTKSIGVFSVTAAGSNTLVEELEDYGVAQFSQVLETLKDGEFAPLLMSEREVVEVTDLDVTWATEFLEANPEALNGRGSKSVHALVDVIVTAFVEKTGLDVKGKRVQLGHLDALIEFATKLLQPTEVPGTPVMEDGIEDAVVIPVEVAPKVEDDQLFSEGVAEQTQETAAPLTISDVDLFNDDIEEAVVIEESSDVLDSAEVAVNVLKELAEDPARAMLIINNSTMSIKDTLYREVFNTLPTVQKRSSDAYSELEKDHIKSELNNHIRDVLKVVSEYKTKMEEERLASLPYNADMVEAVINDSVVHSSFLENDEVRANLANVVSDYLNGNSADAVLTGDEPKRRISEVLRKISLYDYESEALINSTYRATNVPPPEKLIRNTKVIARALTKLYTAANVWSGEEAKLIEHAYAEMFNKDTGGLNLSKETVELIVNRGLTPKTYTKTGEYITIMVPVANLENIASVIVITASQARILNIDKVDGLVTGVRVVDRANQRGDVLKLILE